MGKVILIGLLALPAAEIALFILIASKIGFAPAFGLLLATSAAGILVLRSAGRARLERLRVAVTQAGVAGLEAGGDAFLTVAAGILLLLPGFITDVLALLLLTPPVRQWIGTRFQAFARTQSGRRDVVDLDRDEWTQIPDQALDDPRRRNDLP
jgi:UPF0716 protein FxsA